MSLGFDRDLDYHIEEHENPKEECDHEFEYVGNTERIDKHTLAREIHCIKCDLRDQDIEFIEVDQKEEE
jgi:hypothetical protein